MAWYDFLEKASYQRFFERDRFEKETEPKETWLTKAYERFRMGAEAVQPMERFRQVEQRLQPAAPERPSVIPSAEEARYRPFDPVALSRERAEREAEARERAGVRAIRFTDPTTGEEKSVTPPFDPREKSEEDINEWLRGHLEKEAKRKAGWSLPMAMFMALTEPRLPEPAREAIRKVPVAGPIAEPHITATTSPLGGLATLAFPGVTAGMIGGATALGTAGKGLERAGVPVAETPIGRWGPSGVGELAGLVAGPVALPALERAALRGAKALPGAARGVAARGERIIPSARRAQEVLMEEAGGLKPTPESLMAKISRGEAFTPEEEMLLRQPAYRAVKTAYQEQIAKPPTPTAGARLTPASEEEIWTALERNLAPEQLRLYKVARYGVQGERPTVEGASKALGMELKGLDKLGWRYSQAESRWYRPAVERGVAAPKPAAQVFREATEVRGPTRAEALERWRTRLEGAEPPREPPTTPPTAEAAGGIPAENAGNRFVAPLREFDDVMEEVVTSDNPLIRALVGKTGINPSVLSDTPTGKALTAYWRQRVAGELLTETAISPAIDVHAQRITGRVGRTFRISTEGEVKNLTVTEGQSRMWQDVFSRPDDYSLTSAQRAFVDDYLQVVRETEAMRVEAGLKPRPIISKEGWFYVPRQVKGLRGIELRRPSNPGLQRIYEEAQDGVAAGAKYSDNPRATLEIHVRAAYREVAQKQLADALEPLSITPKELVPEPVRIRMEKAVKARVSAERQLRAMNRDYLKAAGKGKPGWPKREAGLGVMRAEIQGQKATVQSAKETYWSAKKAYTRAMESARKAEVAPGNLFGQAEETIPIASWRNRFFPREQADALNEALGSFLRPAQKASPFARGLEVTGNYIRFLSAVGDFAEPFIQGLPTLAYRPNVWAKSALRHYQAFFDPTVQARFMRQHLETFQKMAQHGAPIGDPEFFAALTREGGFSAGKLLEILPKGAEARKLLQQGGKQSFGRFQASYNTGLGSNRAYLYESLQPTWKGTEDELWQFIKNMTGGLDSRALGVGPSQRGFESVWLAFSPRLLRSTAALITDAARPTTAQGQAALKALAGLATFATGTYVLTGLVLGKSWEEIGTGLNPTEGKKFLAHEINGDWIGVGGQVRAISQFLAHGFSAIAPGGEPIESFVSTSQFENPVLRFYSSRGAPAMNIVGGLVEAGTGLNVMPFDQVDSGPDLIKHLGTSALPFAIQGKLEGEQWATTGAALVGARTQAETPYEKRDKARDEAAQRMFGKNWEDLLQGEQNKVRAAEPALRELETTAIELGAERGYDYSQRTQDYRAQKDTRAQEGERLLEADPTGREWAGWRKTVGIQLNTVWEMLTQQYGIKEEPREPKFVEDLLAERYWNLEPDANNDGIISNAEWREYDSQAEAILSEAKDVGVSEDYIKHGYRGQMWPNNPNLQSIEERYQQAKEIAREYYDIPAKIGMSAEKQDRAARNAEIAQANATQQGKPFLVALLEMKLSAAEQDEAFIYHKLPANPARKMYRYDYPKEWELFKAFYSDILLETPVEPEMAAAGVR